MKRLIHNLRSPAYGLVLETARQNWWLISITLGTHLLSALLEGTTLGVIYLAVAYLTSASEGVAETEAASSAHVEWLQTLSSIISLPPEQMFLVLILAAVLLQILLSLCNYSNKVSTAYLSARAQTHVTSQVFNRIMTFSYGCVSQYKVGDLVLFANDAALAVERQIEEVNNIIVGTLFALMYLVVIVRLSAVLAIAAALLTLIIAFVQYKLLPRLSNIVKRVTETKVESSKYITENIQALRLLHTFGTQSLTVSNAHQLLSRTQEQLQKRAFLFFLPQPILNTIPMIALAILAASAVLLQDGETVILPMLLTFLLALQRLSARLKATASTITRFVDNSARMLRLENILRSDDKVFEQSGHERFTQLTQDIEFQQVNLSYTDDHVLALKDLTFTIPQKKVTALVGESGAGKSSILDLMMGLYQPTSGEIIVNGQPLSNYQLEHWRKQIGVVSQDTFIFNNSILENLRYGRPSASWDEVVDAAKAAQAHDFILALPDGYDTIVGERGYRLSGGQRQRITLARALIKQPEILILDEATSALDSESEKLIQQALDQFQKERTVLVVAHRLSTIIDADQILVLEKGEIIEQGSHQELIRQDGRYAKHWKIQSQGTLAER